MGSGSTARKSEWRHIPSSPQLVVFVTLPLHSPLRYFRVFCLLLFSGALFGFSFAPLGGEDFRHHNYNIIFHIEIYVYSTLDLSSTHMVQHSRHIPAPTTFSHLFKYIAFP